MTVLTHISYKIFLYRKLICNFEAVTVHNTRISQNINYLIELQSVT